MAVVFIYYFFDPLRFNIFPKCPFFTLTGFDCPGCGSQRALHALLHGNVAQACNYNLLLVLSLPLLFIHLLYKIRSLFTGKPLQWRLLYHPKTPVVIFMITALFWILRNIPVAPFSYLSAAH
ncbi:DUF2752 domain-containing protein [Mucilaginibacter roseus]|uniref:DUF2752 domain-containing protein n=1 Tax=Mucilaginibacter roseus TaxID=1528868 RepID=A0ABS8U2P1_9SPHI|nr:DUF2752 domain-containing protein [Mucilaginibacter roseus]MCD8740902.1 DUF2752 domain-containing protein [Mucilaginibacter roseus]